MPLRDPEDRKVFAEMLSIVNAALSAGGRELTRPVIDLYWRALAEYDIAAVRLALDRHVKNPDSGKFMPAPSELIRMLAGSTNDAASIAWAMVERTVRLVGGYESVVFDDPLIHRCIADIGGWTKLCSETEAEMPFRAKAFTNMYRAFAMRREIPPYPPRLIGKFEASNSSRGYELAPPVLVGDRIACERVMAGGAAHGLLEFTRADAASPELLTK